MTKTKAKILLFIFLSVIGLIIGFFFSGYINACDVPGRLRTAAHLPGFTSGYPLMPMAYQIM